MRDQEHPSAAPPRGVAHRHVWRPEGFHERCSRCGWGRAWVQLCGQGLVQRYFRRSPLEYGAIAQQPPCEETR